MSELRSLVVVLGTPLLAYGLTACGAKQASTLTHPPKRASFPLYVSVPGTTLGAGVIYKVAEPTDVDTPSEMVPLISGLDFPSAVAVAGDGTIYFTERPTPTTGKLQKFVSEDESPETIADGLADPQGLAIDSVGKIFLAEMAADVISLVNTDGTKEEIYSDLGGPRSLTTDTDDNLFVVESIAGSVAKLIPDGTRIELADGLRNPVAAGPGLIGNTFYLVNNSGLGDGLAVKVDSGGSESSYLDQLVNPQSMDWEDSTVLFIAEGAPANRIIKYSRVSGTRTELVSLPGEPHTIAFTPIN